MEEQKRKKLRIVIITLSILLAISGTGLVGTLVHNHFANKPSSVIVPDNIITPEETSSADALLNGGNSNGNNPQIDNGTLPSESTESPNDESTQTAVTIELFDRQPDDNTPFNVVNMFPGDTETEYFCVKVSHHDTVTVKYSADIRPGYEKLSEVLKCRITLLTADEVLYDGLMRDMPESLDHTVYTEQHVESELYYEISVYLETNVGNEYMNKDLVADFIWWVEGDENLDPPVTGDAPSALLWFCVALVSLALLMFVLVKRRKEVKDEH